jgi:hypothetical protein
MGVPLLRKNLEEWQWFSLREKMPAPSQKTWDAAAATKAQCIRGGCFCSGRPVLGRAAFRYYNAKLTRYQKNSALPAGYIQGYDSRVTIPRDGVDLR